IFGYLVQLGMLSPALKVGPLSTLLATFGLSIVIQNALQQGYSADTRALDVGSLISASLHITGQISVAYLSLITFALAIVVLAALQLFLSRTGTGRIMRATADDPEAATLSGANARPAGGLATAIPFATGARA